MKLLNYTLTYHFKRWKFKDKKYFKTELILISTYLDKTKTEPARTLHEFRD